MKVIQALEIQQIKSAISSMNESEIEQLSEGVDIDCGGYIRSGVDLDDLIALLTSSDKWEKVLAYINNAKKGNSSSCKASAKALAIAKVNAIP
jgi:hypothetical protein